MTALPAIAVAAAMTHIALNAVDRHNLTRRSYLTSCRTVGITAAQLKQHFTRERDAAVARRPSIPRRSCCAGIRTSIPGPEQRTAPAMAFELQRLELGEALRARDCGDRGRAEAGPGRAQRGLSCMAMACSTSEISVDLVERRSRASHWITGTCGLTDNASATSSTSCGKSP